MTIGENMKFVYSNWYIVMAVLLVLIAACIVAFVLMDKKDKELIKGFVDKNKVDATAPTPAEPVAEESKAEPVEEIKE